MPKLLIADRRLIAIHSQYGKKSNGWIIRQGFTRNQVRRWREVPMTASDADFSDTQRAGRPKILSAVQEKRLMKRLERDDPMCVARAAEEFGVSTFTVRKIGHELGDLLSRHLAIFVSDVHKVCRDLYSKDQLGQDHTVKCWGDHTLLQVPPEPVRQRVWRARDSIKPVPKAIRWKAKTTFLMFVAGCGTALSDPVFAVSKKRRKRRRAGERTPGYRWEVHTVDAAQMKEDLTETVFPFMEEQKLDELILDNAPCQDGLRSWIEEQGYKSPGFASKRRAQRNGYPPNSPGCMLLDATVFGRFKVLYAIAQPQTIVEAMAVSRKILKEMTTVGQKWVAHLDDLYREIIAANGGASHYMIN